VNAATVRRLLVLGVCTVGVAALYVAPGLARTSAPSAVPRPEEGPTARASTSRDRAGERTASTTSTTTASPRARRSETSTGTSTAPVPPPERRSAPARPRSSGGATAYDADRSVDRVAPAPVRWITRDSATPDELTLSWPAASDDVGVTAYRVVLNGFPVATTTQTRATVAWFNDDLEEHVVQVRALDAAGNESASSPNLVVERPPAPSTTPRPESSAPAADPASPTPSSSPAPSSEPTVPDGTSTGTAGPGDQQGLQQDVEPTATATATAQVTR